MNRGYEVLTPDNFSDFPSTLTFVFRCRRTSTETVAWNILLIRLVLEHYHFVYHEGATAGGLFSSSGGWLDENFH